MIDTSVPNSKPPSTMRDASAMAARIMAMVASGAIERRTDQEGIVTGAQTSISRSVARQAAKRISAPFACIGNCAGTGWVSRLCECIAEDGVQRAGEHGGVERGIRPAPERPIGGVVG